MAQLSIQICGADIRTSKNSATSTERSTILKTSSIQFHRLARTPPRVSIADSKGESLSEIAHRINWTAISRNTSGEDKTEIAYSKPLSMQFVIFAMTLNSNQATFPFMGGGIYLKFNPTRHRNLCVNATRDAQSGVPFVSVLKMLSLA